MNHQDALPVRDPYVVCGACKKAGYRVEGRIGACPYEVDPRRDVPDCMHNCCESCRRDCADAL